MTEFDRPDVTLYRWKDIKIKLLTNPNKQKSPDHIKGYSCYHVGIYFLLLREHYVHRYRRCLQLSVDYSTIYMPTSAEDAAVFCWLEHYVHLYRRCCCFLLTIALCPPLQKMLLFLLTIYMPTFTEDAVSVDYSTMHTCTEDAAVFCWL